MRQRQRAVRSDLVRDELPWVELVSEIGISEVRCLLIDCGVSSAKAAGIAVWLDDQAKKIRVFTEDSSIRYRSVLREIGPPPTRDYGETYSGVAQSELKAA